MPASLRRLAKIGKIAVARGRWFLSGLMALRIPAGAFGQKRTLCDVDFRCSDAPSLTSGWHDARRDPWSRQPRANNRQRDAGCVPSGHYRCLSEISFIFAYSRWRASEYAAKRSDHVALIAKAPLDGDLRTRQTRFTQQFDGTLDAESRGGICESFPRRTSVSRSQSGRMQTGRGGKSGDSSSRVVLEQTGDVVNPCSTPDGRLHVRRRQER